MASSTARGVGDFLIRHQRLHEQPTPSASVRRVMPIRSIMRLQERRRHGAQGVSSSRRSRPPSPPPRQVKFRRNGSVIADRARSRPPADLPCDRCARCRARMSRSIVRTLTSKRSEAALPRPPGRPQLLHERIEPVEPVHVPEPEGVASLRRPARPATVDNRAVRSTPGLLISVATRSRSAGRRRGARLCRADRGTAAGGTRRPGPGGELVHVLLPPPRRRLAGRRSTAATSSPSSRTKFDQSSTGRVRGCGVLGDTVHRHGEVARTRRPALREQLPRGAPEQQRAGVEDGVQPELVSDDDGRKRDAIPRTGTPCPSGPRRPRRAWRRRRR